MRTSLVESFEATTRGSIRWSRGVTVSTLDSESSDRGSNPRGTFPSIPAGKLDGRACWLARRAQASQAGTGRVVAFALTHATWPHGGSAVARPARSSASKPIGEGRGCALPLPATYYSNLWLGFRAASNTDAATWHDSWRWLGDVSTILALGVPVSLLPDYVMRALSATSHQAPHPWLARCTASRGRWAGFKRPAPASRIGQA